MLSKRTGGNLELTKESSFRTLLLSFIQSHLSQRHLSLIYPPRGAGGIDGSGFIIILLGFYWGSVILFTLIYATPRRKGRKSQSEKSKMNILNLFSCFLIFFMFEIDGRTISEMPLCSTSSSSSLPCFLHAHNIVKFR